jgi:hypothetical protein
MSNTPTQADTGNGVTPANDWTEVQAGSGFWCGLKANGALYCRISGGALEQAAGLAVAHLFDFNTRTCGKLMGGELVCLINAGDGWVQSVAPYPIPPVGTDWTDYEYAGQLQCGLRANGQRWCAGARYAGSFGDGFDERVPALIQLPE